jgi:hypothetical protein
MQLIYKHFDLICVLLVKINFLLAIVVQELVKQK